MWFYLALSCALFYSFRGILEKRIIQNVNKYILGLAIRLFAIPFFLIPFVFSPSSLAPIFHLNLSFWFAIFMVCCVNTPIETVFYYEALKNEEITLVLPILALSPVLTIVWGLFLKEVPTIFGFLGVLCIILGIYALKLEQAKEGLLQPILHLKNNRAIRLMAIVMLSQSVSGIFDKIGVSNSNAYVYLAINYIGVSITLYFIALYKARSHLGQLVRYFRQFALIAVLIAAYTLLYGLALQVGFAGYVVAIKSSYILFTILLGLLFFKEEDAKQKILASGFIFAGLVLLKVFG